MYKVESKFASNTLSVVLLLLVGCHTSEVHRTPEEWHRLAISVLEKYLEEPGNEALARTTEPFLRKADINLSVFPASENPISIGNIRQFAAETHAEAVITSIDWDNTVIGSLRCGIGGGYFVNVVLDAHSGKHLLSAVVPGE